VHPHRAEVLYENNANILAGLWGWRHFVWTWFHLVLSHPFFGNYP